MQSVKSCRRRKRFDKVLSILLRVWLIIASFNAYSGTYVVLDAEITNIANTSSNGANFALATKGGTGPCTNQWIVFYESDASNSNAHQRAYSTALMAFATGLKVNIHNYTSSSCDHASYIEVKKE